MSASAGRQRRAQLASARLYLVCDSRPGGRSLEDVLPAAIRGGVDVFQLREKQLPEEDLLDAARRAVALCREHGALSLVNDRPDVALAVGADGVHVGQEDMPVARARALIGEQLLLGLSTHTQAEIEAARRARVDYIGVGPVHATPTKPGRRAVGAGLVAFAARRAGSPFFAIGGLDAGNLREVLDAGASRVCVLRAVADASDPQEAARVLRELLSG
ncbi:MAG: thiamine phosphate synthase [Solirubrobacteraceae bacterium]